MGEELIKSFVGRTADAVTNMLVEHLGITEATAQELFSLHRSIKEELMENELAAKPFAVKALSVLKDHGFALGLATSSYRPVAERELEPFGMQAYFDSITCGDEIEHGKPAPDIYLLAAERLGMWPEECAVVEDSPNGVRAGAAAGMPVFLVPDTIEPTSEMCSARSTSSRAQLGCATRRLRNAKPAKAAKDTSPCRARQTRGPLRAQKAPTYAPPPARPCSLAPAKRAERAHAWP